MKEKMLDRFKFSDELKEKLVMLVVYQNRPLKELSRQYGLPNAHMLANWVNVYKRTLEKKFLFYANLKKGIQLSGRDKTSK